MSRKNKIGLDYFSHDVDMKDDKKIRLIIAKHGLTGYGVYNRLLEEIYRDSGYFLFIDQDFEVLFADDCKLKNEEFKKILEDLIYRNLFSKELFEKYGIITSKRIQENYCSATERRKEVTFLKEFLLINVESKYNLNKVNVNLIEFDEDIFNENVNIISENDDIKPQRKVKERESKGKKSQKIFDDNSREMKICKYFFAVLQKSRPEQTEPNWQNWCKDIDLFIRKMKPTDQEIKTVILYAHDPANTTDKFSWIPNLRSPKKLREHFERILLQSQTAKSKTLEDEHDEFWNNIERNRNSNQNSIEDFSGDIQN